MSDAVVSRLSGMRDAVIDLALHRRPAGRPVPAVEPCTPLDAYLRAAEQLHGVLTSLSGADWGALAHHEIGTVRDLIVHLTGVERVALGWVEADGDAPLAVTDHLHASRDASAEFVDAPDDEIVVAWFDGARRFAAACAVADPSKPVLAHDLPTDVDGLLVLRAFELWAHLLDVCGAVGRPEPEVDEPRLALMSSRLMQAAPLALLLRGVDVSSPSRVRFVLTGLATRCYDNTFGGESVDGGRPDVTVVIDTVDVCRIAARRASAADVDVAVEGDADVADVILGALDAFARD